MHICIIMQGSLTRITMLVNMQKIGIGYHADLCSHFTVTCIWVGQDMDQASQWNVQVI